MSKTKWRIRFQEYEICLGYLCSGIFLVRQGQYFVVNISARLLNISNSSNFIPHFVLLISRLPDIAQKTACTRNEAMDVAFQMKYVSVF